MSEIETFTQQLHDARVDLLAALDGVTQAECERVPPPGGEGEAQWGIIETLWHVGHAEDRFRRMIDQAISHRPLTDDAPRTRPAHMVTPELLIAWLDQTRRPTEVLLQRMTDADLDIEFVRPNGQTRTPRWVLEVLVHHDRDHAAQVRALRDMDPTPAAGA